MANKNPSPATRFQKGQSGNKSGKPKGLITPDRVRAVVAKLSGMNREQLLEVVKDPKSQMFEVMFASVMAKAAKDGDYGRLNFLLDRTIGRTVDQKDVKIQPVIYETSIRPDGSLVQNTIALLDSLDEDESE